MEWAILQIYFSNAHVQVLQQLTTSIVIPENVSIVLTVFHRMPILHGLARESVSGLVGDRYQTNGTTQRWRPLTLLRVTNDEKMCESIALGRPRRSINEFQDR